MNRSIILWLMLAAVVLVSCGKDEQPIQPDKQAPRLKNMVINNLPSPYFYFDYNGNGTVKRMGHSSGLWDYEITYSGNRIARLVSLYNPSHVTLEYFYADGMNPELVKYIDNAGIVIKRAFISYQSNRLRSIEWERKVTVGYASERTISFDYDADGNLLMMTDHRFEIGSQGEATYVTRYEDYDTGQNAGGFSLMQANSEPIILLPNVTLQKNNPRKVVFSGMDAGYTAEYNYTYNDKNLLTLRTGTVKFSGGPNDGQTFQSVCNFTWY